MKPAWFDYYAPRELNEALNILGDAGEDVRVLAGGQSLMPMLNLRILSPAVVVDINRIEALNGLHAGEDCLTVGALVRHADLLRSAEVCRGWPLLAEATRQVAHMAIRNRGTVCGSVSHNDPAAEHPSVLVIMGGTVVIAGKAGRRELAAEKFFTGTLICCAVLPFAWVGHCSRRRPSRSRTWRSEIAGLFAAAFVITIRRRSTPACWSPWAARW